MDVADKNKFIDLAKQHNMVLDLGSKKGSDLKVKLLTFSERLQARFAGFDRFKAGKLEFLFRTPPPKQDNKTEIEFDQHIQPLKPLQASKPKVSKPA